MGEALNRFGGPLTNVIRGKDPLKNMQSPLLASMRGQEGGSWIPFSGGGSSSGGGGGGTVGGGGRQRRVRVNQRQGLGTLGSGTIPGGER